MRVSDLRAEDADREVCDEAVSRKRNPKAILCPEKTFPPLLDAQNTIFDVRWLVGALE